jgi:hypothetical protein
LEKSWAETMLRSDGNTTRRTDMRSASVRWTNRPVNDNEVAGEQRLEVKVIQRCVTQAM